MSDADWPVLSLSSFIGHQALFVDGDWVETKDQDDEGLNRLIQLADVGDGRFLNKSQRFMNDAQFSRLGCTQLQSGDILIARMPEPLGRACIFPPQKQRCATVVDVAILRAPTANRDWLFYSINSDAARRQIEALSAGTTRTRISRSLLEKIRFPTPSPDVQAKIARILLLTDTAIEKTEALIEKYQQIKAGLMHDLFTRGIGPDGKLRPPREQAPELYQETPIGWIPREWSMPKLGNHSNICSGVTLGQRQTPDQTITVPYLRVANVQDGYLDLSEVNDITVTQRTLDALRLVPGDVLMNEGGDYDKLGRGTVWEGQIDPCVYQNHVFRVRVDAKVLRPFFLAFWSQSEFGKKYFVLSSKQSTNLASINSRQLHTFPIALPAMDEQEAIEHRVFSLNKRIEALNAELKKLCAQKAGLMHDLLTGKVSVNPDPPESANA